LATLRSLGVVLEGSRAVGQLKFDMCMTELSDACLVKMRQSMGFRKVSSATRYLLGVSIWPGEEVILLEACRLLRSQGRDVRLLLIPRHAERADGMLKNIRSMGFSVSRRSTQTNVMEDVVVHLADTTGEMHALCQCGHLGLVGKSFAPYVGGQTPLELALCGVPMVYGPEMSNFREICEMLESEGLVSKVMTAQEAVQVLVTKMQDENALERVGQGLQVWAKQHTGVVLTYLDELSVFFGV